MAKKAKVTSKAALREETDALLKDFLKKGGKVTVARPKRSKGKTYFKSAKRPRRSH